MPLFPLIFIMVLAFVGLMGWLFFQIVLAVDEQHRRGDK